VPRGGKKLIQPLVYEVGADITPEKYQQAIEKIGDWFAQSRKTKEPVAAAKYYLDCCLKGVKPSDGKSPWFSMAKASLESRVRSACRFDIEAMEPLVNANEKLRIKKAKERERAKAKKESELLDANMPSEYRKKLAGEAVYGDDPLVFFTTAELERRKRLREAYLRDFPQLRSVASESKLDMLLDLTLLLERIRFRQAKDIKGKTEEYQIQQLTKQIVELEKALNIHPDQLAKQQKEKEGGTIGEAVRRLDELNVPELRERWLAEELLVLFQMYHTPSPRDNMGGYQLDEVGLFGLTRCRTCECASCGTRNYAGLSIEEIEKWLFDKGYLNIVEMAREGQEDAGSSSVVGVTEAGIGDDTVS
jgi:uncharacterized protein YnzC (UPF0291/DUF896 family)